jgi:hypothetical protein
VNGGLLLLSLSFPDCRNNDGGVSECGLRPHHLHECIKKSQVGTISFEAIGYCGLSREAGLPWKIISVAVVSEDLADQRFLDATRDADASPGDVRAKNRSRAVSPRALPVAVTRATEILLH